MNNRQQKHLDRLTVKVERCINYYNNVDKDEGLKGLINLILAEKIRATKHIRPPLATKAKNNDPRAILVEKVTSLQLHRFIRNLKQVQNFYDIIIKYIGGKNRPGDPLKITNWKLKGYASNKFKL